MRKTILAVTTLIGTIIGAGVFGIPYVIMQSGLLVGLIHIIIIAALTMIITLYLGEIALRTKENYQLTGYAQKYLGTKGKLLMMASLAFGIYAAALAYLIGTSESLSFLFFETTKYSLYMGILFWAFMTVITLFGIKALQEGEFFGVIIILVLIIALSVFFANKIDVSNLTYQPILDIKDYFVPFGVILFAFLGYTTIPEVERILGKDKRGMKSAIIIATLISTIVYILFPIIVIGLKGQATPALATIALGKPFILLGIITMLTSYLALSIALIDMFQFDYNQSKIKSWLYTSLIPLILFIIMQLTNTANFTKVLGIGGVISGGLTSILIIFMANKAKYLGDRKPEYSIPTHKLIIWIMIILFALGTIGEIVNTI